MNFLSPFEDFIGVFFNLEMHAAQNFEGRYGDVHKRLRSVHFGVVVVELINCKCG